MDGNYELDLIDLWDMEDLEIVDIGVPRIRRSNIYRLRANPFNLCNAAFRYKYRFSKEYAARIVDLIREDITLDPRGCPIAPELQVLSAMRCWARHEIQDDAGDLHGLSQPTISVVCKRVASALARIAPSHIKMPTTIAEQEEAMRKFREIANFPTVIGAIDCTHIKLKKVSADGQGSVNRKGFASANVQVVCDADLRIMDIVTRWNGSVHDSRIFRECRLKQRFEAGQFSGILLGDSGYPCTSYLFTPVRNPSTPQERRYNRAHISTRNTIERCFGTLKQRFRGLLRGMFVDVTTAKKTIVACAVLHNVAIEMNEVFDEPSDDDDDDDDEFVRPEAIVQHNDRPVYNLHTIRGNLRRSQFIQNYF